MGIKKFTLLHSNDMHGDFYAEAQGAPGNLIGGLALLSGYISRVRHDEKNVLFVIAGDMVQGSMIDSEFKGISTMEIMNYLAPDVVTLGNHELDYGLPHLLFLEKMANFPIVNANMYIKKYNRRLMRPYLVLEVDGYKILFIGILTETVLQSLKRDASIATFITLSEAATEVGRICNTYKDHDIDLTVLLTHIGFESDKELAALLDPAWGVDLIIGGHSHTILDQPASVNNILITQAGVGTNQVGRFDLVVDDETNKIVEWKWKLIPITNQLAEPDVNLQNFIDSFKQVVDRKYNVMLCRFAQPLTHPHREQETSMGNLFADIFAETQHIDVILLGSGSIRGSTLGPLVTLGELYRVFGYDDTLNRFTITGAQLKRIFAHIMRPENRNGEGECFQVNRGVRAMYNNATRALESLMVKNMPVKDDAAYTLGVQGFHVKSAEQNIGLANADLEARTGIHIAATSMRDVLEEYLRAHQNLNSQVEGRLVYK